MKRIILLFGLIFSLVAVKANAGETPTNEQKAHNQALRIHKMVTLSEDQIVKVEAAMLTKLNAIDAINNDVTKDGTAKQAAIDLVKRESDAKIKEILTPDQHTLLLRKREEAKTRNDIAH